LRALAPPSIWSSTTTSLGNSPVSTSELTASTRTVYPLWRTITTPKVAES
jgi:hypothetical protein